MANLGRKPSIYHPDPQKPVLYSFPNKDQLRGPLASLVYDLQKDAIAKKGKFTVAISGGSLPDMLTELIGHEVNGIGVGWEHWHIFYADERCVPLDHADSNHKLCEEKLYSKIRESGAKPPSVHPIDDTVFRENPSVNSNPDTLTNEQVQDIAVSYRSALVDEFTAGGATAAYPVFDLVLLGMGPDGHTCSLFPGKDFLFPDHEEMADFTEEEKEEERNAAWVGWVVESPKPPPKRITLTFAVLNHAVNVVFVAAGKEKAEILPKVFENINEFYTPAKSDAEEKALLKKSKSFLPPARIKPATGLVHWFVDDAASADTKYTRTDFKL